MTSRGEKGRGKFYYHEVPYYTKPKPFPKTRSVQKITDTAYKNGYSPDHLRRTIRLLEKNDLLDKWEQADPHYLLELYGCGKKTVELLLLARGEDPSVLEEYGNKDKALSVCDEFVEALSMNESVASRFEDLRVSVLRGSWHPEMMNEILDLSFRLGLEY